MRWLLRWIIKRKVKKEIRRAKRLAKRKHADLMDLLAVVLRGERPLLTTDFPILGGDLEVYVCPQRPSPLAVNLTDFTIKGIGKFEIWVVWVPPLV